MRIEDFKQHELSAKKKKGASATSASAGISPFSQILSVEETEFTDYKVELESLRQEIEEAGSALEEEPSLAEFNKFRDLIRSLTKKVSKEAYKLKTVGIITRKQYTVIATIDKELNDLYKLVMSEQKNRIAIASKVVKLKGLVIDVLS